MDIDQIEVEDFCKNCGTFGTISGNGLCKLCYDEQFEKLYNTSDEDSMCEFDDNNNYIEQDQNDNVETELKKAKHLVQDFIIPFVFQQKQKSDLDSITCAICMENIECGDRVVSLPCAHIFHIKCIDPWLQKNSHCPICRTDILGHSNIQNLK